MLLHYVPILYNRPAIGARMEVEIGIRKEKTIGIGKKRKTGVVDRDLGGHNDHKKLEK